MKIDGEITVNLSTIAERAEQMEALGFDGVFTFEGPHDPFLPLVLAAEHTERVDLATEIAVAFARSPMTLANIGYDLNQLSRGRAILGRGSQIKPHIERRFSMTWSDPVPRMRELVAALRAIWTCWQEGTPLNFRGEYYRHTLMTPMFSPGPSPYGMPRVWLAGVGPKMTEIAGEVGDGFIVHPFSTVSFFESVTKPALERGFARGDNDRSKFEISWPVIAITGTTDEELAKADLAVRHQLAFYGSTPAYRVVLDHHGWGDLQPELNRLSKEGRWDEMAGLMPDEIIDAIAVRAPFEQLAGVLHDRFEGLVDRIAINAPYLRDRDALYRRGDG
jgi:probable F420-dependent oxidoreductase